jgi:cold shock CspA family protein/ribosome-associated translation inhibitor RaiA
MQIPLQVTFLHMEASPALEQRARELASRFETFSQQIIRCHVVIEAPERHQQQGGHFHVRITITVPGKEIDIRRAGPAHPSHEDAYVALRDAFKAARRKLQDYERGRRGDVKTHVAMPHGHISELDVDRGFGRIETDDGRLIYFHRNSVLDASFDSLRTGAKVRFSEERGELGPQASTVHVVS